MSLRDKQELVCRIWTNSKATHTNKLMLLALVEHADEDGFCWPSRDTLGQMVGHRGNEKSIRRNALDNLIALAKLNEIIIWEQPVKRGRGYTNIYLITTGLTNDQIREIIQRRFRLTPDEVDHVLEQKSELYMQLCLDHRVSTDTLKDTRKGDTPITDSQEMSDTPITQNGQMGDTGITHNQKGDTGITRTESLNPESIPNKESESRASPLEQRQALAKQITETCGYDATTVRNGTRQKLEDALGILWDKKATPQLVKRFGEEYWWGKSPPRPEQLTEEWYRFLQWLKRPDKVQKMKVSAL